LIEIIKATLEITLE